MRGRRLAALGLVGALASAGVAGADGLGSIQPPYAEGMSCRLVDVAGESVVSECPGDDDVAQRGVLVAGSANQVGVCTAPVPGGTCVLPSFAGVAYSRFLARADAPSAGTLRVEIDPDEIVVAAKTRLTLDAYTESSGVTAPPDSVLIEPGQSFRDLATTLAVAAGDEVTVRVTLTVNHGEPAALFPTGRGSAVRVAEVRSEYL